MTRQPTRALARRSALGLSLLLLAGALTVPAAAEEVPPGIIAPVAGDEFTIGDTLFLEANSGGEEVVNWAVRLEDPDRNSSGTKAGNVDGQDDPFTLDRSSFSAEVDTTGWDPSEQYFFVFNWGNPSDDATRDVVQFSILDPLDDFEDAEIADCSNGQECSIAAEGAQTYTASTDTQTKEGQTARLGLRIPGSDDSVSGQVFNACQNLLADDQRLGGDVAHLVPVGFAGGSLTVTNLIPKSIIKDDVNRGTDAFQVCIAPTEAEAEGYGAYFDEGSGPPAIGDTGLVGPFLLDDCGADPSETACVESRERLPGADLLITYRIPAVDPWMM